MSICIRNLSPRLITWGTFISKRNNLHSISQCNSITSHQNKINVGSVFDGNSLQINNEQVILLKPICHKITSKLHNFTAIKANR